MYTIMQPINEKTLAKAKRSGGPTNKDTLTKVSEKTLTKANQKTLTKANNDTLTKVNKKTLTKANNDTLTKVNKKTLTKANNNKTLTKANGKTLTKSNKIILTKISSILTKMLVITLNKVKLLTLFFMSTFVFLNKETMIWKKPQLLKRRRTKPKIPPFALQRQMEIGNDITSFKNSLSIIVDNIFNSITSNTLLISSLTANLISIILQIVFLVRKNVNKKIITCSLIASLYAFIAQIIMMFYPNADLGNFSKFVESKLENKPVTVSRLIEKGIGANREQLRHSGVKPSKLWAGHDETVSSINSVDDFLKWAQKCNCIEQYEQVWDYLSYYKPHITSATRCIPEKPKLDSSFEDKEYLRQISFIFSIYTVPNLSAIWNLSPFESNMLQLAKLRYAPAQDATADDALSGCSRQMGPADKFKTILSTFIGLVSSAIVCVMYFINGKPVDFSTLSRNWAAVDFLQDKMSEIIEKLALGAESLTKAESLREQVQKYINDLNDLLQFPATEYVKKPQLRTRLTNALNEVMSFLKIPVDPKECDKRLLSSIYLTANTFRLEVERTLQAQPTRIEPRLFLFSGPGSVGKSRTTLQLAANLGEKHFPHIDKPRRSIAITASGKYFPMLTGEKIWIVDEIGAKKDLREDLIMRDLRGLCSPVKFVAETAAIEGKGQVAECAILLGSTNTDPDTLLSRLAELSDQSSIEPTCSRITWFKCVRNEKKYGKLNPVRRDEQPYDTTGKMDHVRYVLMEYDAVTCKYVEKTTLTFDQVSDMISAKYLALEKQYLQRIAEMGFVQQMQSKHHFVINLHGKPRAGKGTLVDSILPDIKSLLQYPICKFTKDDIDKKIQPFAEKQIVILDDVFSVRKENRSAGEHWYMDLYNNLLPNGSVIIICSNMIPKKTFPKITISAEDTRDTYLARIFPGAPSCSLQLESQYTLDLNEPGVLRRMGFTGNFLENTTHSTDACFFVDNDSYYVFKGKPKKISLINLAINLLASLFSIYICVPFVLVSIVYIYYQLYYTFEEKYDITKCKEYIFKKYQDYLKFYNELVTVEGHIPVEQYDLIMQTEHFSNLDNMSQLELIANTFSHYEKFEKNTAPLKIYVDKELAPKLHINASRFLQFKPTATHESIVHFCKLVYKMFCDTNMEVKMLVKIGDIGVYSLIGTRLVYQSNFGGDARFSDFTVQETISGFDCSYNFDGKPVSRSFSYANISNYLFRGEPLLDLTNIDMSEAKLITSYFSQQKIICNREIQKCKANIYKEYLQEKCSKVMFSAKYIVDFISDNACAKILVGIVAILLSVLTVYSLKKIFTESSDSEDDKCDYQKKPRMKGRRREDSGEEGRVNRLRGPRVKGKRREVSDDDERRNKRRQQYSSDESEDDTLEQHKPRVKGRRRDISDDEQKYDKQVQITKSIKENITEMTRQSVDTLPAMNGYDECRNLLTNFHGRVVKNECWVINYQSDKEVLTFKTIEQRNEFLSGQARCYGLFVRGRTLVTVNHAADLPIYVACSEFGTNVYRATIIKRFTKECRDFCILTLDKNQYKNNIQNFSDITKNFQRKRNLDDEHVECILKRYSDSVSKKNHEQYLHGVMYYYHDELSSYMDNGEAFSISNFGYVSFSSSKLALTTYGDCGLPYYCYNLNENGTPTIYLGGIHCMGNVSRTYSIGIAALIYQEDFACMHQQSEKCVWCTDNISIKDPLSEKKQCEGHKIVWNNEHFTSLLSYLRELKYYFVQYPKFYGSIRKSSGISSQGSVEHSHTHFMPELETKFSYPQDFKWREHEHSKYGKCLTLIFKSQNVRSLEKILSKLDFVDEFVIYSQYFKEQQTSNKKIVKPHFITELIVTKHSYSVEDKEKLLSPVYQRQIDPELDEYVYEGLRDFEIQISQSILPDTPFSSGQTVSLIGALPYNASHNPKPAYDDMTKIIPFATSVDKLPFSQELDKVPDEQYAQMVISPTTGEVDARVTQTVQWQGGKKLLPFGLKQRVMKNYQKHINTSYADCRELTDHEVFYGLSGPLANGMNGIDVNKSVGFTLSNLFYVTTKSDVLELSETGKYKWADNEASEFLQDWYKNSKKAIREGKTVRTYYLDLVKMEKLKREKNFLGRIFCNCDFNELLLQRKFLGMFLAKSTVFDEAVGVGANFWAIFNNMARELKAKGNYFTGDYKRWDKTVPAELFQMIGIALDKANKQNAHFQQMFKQLYNSYHVSGNTVYQKHRGMPSGALVTANLNSKINELAIYTVFVTLLEDQLPDVSWESFKRLVYVKIYGDDIILGVDDTIIDTFNMYTLRDQLSKLFGFVLDSSEKNGKISKTMNWEELSWCSRYFRKLEERNFYVGALKKSTINSMLHFKRKNLDVSVYASTLNLALFEASAWEEDYFNLVVGDIRKIIRLDKNIGKQVSILTYLEYQNEMFEEGMLYSLVKQVSQELIKIEETCDALIEVENGLEFKKLKLSNNDKANLLKGNLLKRLLETTNNLSKINKTLKECENNKVILERNNTMDYVSLLNLLYQQNEITKPSYEIYPQVNSFIARVSFRKNTLNGKLITGEGLASTKKAARQQAALDAYTQFIQLGIQGSSQQATRKISKVGLYSFVDATLNKQLEYAKKTGKTTYMYVYPEQRHLFILTLEKGMWMKNYGELAYCSNEGLETLIPPLSLDLLKFFLRKINQPYLVDNIGLRICNNLEKETKPEITLQGFQRQMDMSRGDTVPQAKISGFDVSNTAGSNIFTNTSFAQGVTNLNPIAFSLNNIAQTGAPFDLKDSVYNIYKLETTTTVSAVQSVGSEVFRCSLDPRDRPLQTRNWIYQHEDHIPSVDFAIYIGGAAGAIGTLKVGFVKDISKKSFSLEELQSIASVEIALGQSSTVSYQLNDIRQTGLYRKVKNDREPYPGIVALVSNPITNVQKNDTVQYPIQVYTRLNQNYICASPIAIEDTPRNISTLPLDKYLAIPAFDVVINTNQLCNQFQQYATYPDFGYLTGNFDPKFLASNICNYSTVHYNVDDSTVYVEQLDSTFDSSQTKGTSSYSLAALYFGFGKVPKTQNINIGNNVSHLSQATIWSIQPFKLTIGYQSFNVKTAYCFEEGIIIKAEIIRAQQTKVGDTKCLLIQTDLVKADKKILQVFNNNLDFSEQNCAYLATGTGFTLIGMPINSHTPAALSNSNFAFVYATSGSGKWEKEVLRDSDIHSDISPVYEWTFVGTGNTIPTTQVPSGFTVLQFARPGSVLSSNITTIVPVLPGIQNIIKTLDVIRDTLKTEWLVMDYATSPDTIDFPMAYKNGVFLVKTSQQNLIKISQPSTSYLLNIRGSNSPNQITQFLGFGFVPYISQAARTSDRLNVNDALAGASQQMWPAIIGGLGAGVAGAAQGFAENARYNADRAAWERNNDLNRALKERLAKEVPELEFQRKLSLMGYGSTSAQSGNLSRAGIGYVPGGVLNPAEAINTNVSPVSSLNESNRGIITFDANGATKIDSKAWTNKRIQPMTSDDTASIASSLPEHDLASQMDGVKPDNMENDANLRGEKLHGDLNSVIKPLPSTNSFGANISGNTRPTNNNLKSTGF